MKNETISNFANEVKNQLPQVLNEIINQTSTDAEADMMLMGAISTISAALPNIYGLYDQNVVYPNLYLFISAKASSGKGHLAMCRHLVESIHNTLRHNPLLPKQSLFIPANSSATAIYQQLSRNDDSSLIFETEADSLNNAIKSSYGNFSDGLRKAFHHESISYMRRKDNEWVEINKPQLSIVLSGTPQQCRRLIPNTENGLFSRFAILHLPSGDAWKNVFPEAKESKNNFYATQGEKIYELYKHLCCCDEPIEFELSDSQKLAFNTHFDCLQNSYSDDEEFVASVRRMGIITYRIAMVLSALRLNNKDLNTPKISCSNEDFHIALRISKSLLEHAYSLYNSMPKSEDMRKSRESKPQYKAQLLEMLPSEFSRKEAVNLSKKINLSSRTVDNYLRDYLTSQQIENIDFGTFRKIS